MNFISGRLRSTIPTQAVVAIKAWERKHDLAGMSAATRIDLTVQPKEAATGYEKIRQAIMRVKYGPDWQPSDGDGNGAAAAPSDDAEPDRNRQ